ncbi:DinB family protein [uncultured Algibacter sp.]|uniref:DinB family protein n=1 Tax=uncultured Algibacter sp. TaxID=298659 RepID=UPI0026375741|nr:DinB family protein [uncultured Algibacter sp.]
MKALQHKLEGLIQLGSDYILGCSESEISHRRSPEKWSKKEILGHLIDSAVNNLKRFTEIQFEEKPYRFDNYKQNDLVKANDYQNSDTRELLDFWNAINNRIVYLFGIQNEETLNFEIALENGDVCDLRFLMEDYLDHLEYHLNQIIA